MKERIRYRELRITPQEKAGVYTATATTNAPCEVMGEKDSWFESFDHSERAEIDLSRYNNNAPVFFSHKKDLENALGVVNKAEIVDGNRVEVEFKLGDHERGRQAKELIDQGILTSVSAGLVIEKAERAGTHNGKPHINVVKWFPRELSCVFFPADRNAVIHRGEFPVEEERHMPPTPKDDDKKVEVKENKLSERGEVLRFAANVNREMPEAMPLARRMIAEAEKSGTEISLDAFYGELVKRQEADKEEKGLSLRDRQDFSFHRFLSAVAFPQDRELQKAASRELEIARECQRERGTNRSEFSIPASVLTVQGQTRERVVNSAAASDLVGTDHLAGNFIEYLRDRSRVLPLCTSLGNLSGANVDIPRQSGAAETVWGKLEATADDPLNDASYDSVTLNPKSLTGGTSWTRAMAIQSNPEVEMLSRRDLADSFAVNIDKGILVSGGTNAPNAIFGNVKSANQLAIGNTRKLTWAKVVELETRLAEESALTDGGTFAYVANPSVVGVAKTKEKVANTGVFLAEGTVSRDGVQQGLMMNGYRLVSTNVIPRGTFNSATVATGGTDQNLLVFGNFAELLVASFSDIDVLLDPYSMAKRRQIILRAWAEMDFAMRHDASFAYFWDVSGSI